MAAVNPYIPFGSSKSTADVFETLKSGLSHNIFFSIGDYCIGPVCLGRSYIVFRDEFCPRV